MALALAVSAAGAATGANAQVPGSKPRAAAPPQQNPVAPSTKPEGAASDSAGDQSVSVVFYNATLPEVLQNLQQSTGLQFRVEPGENGANTRPVTVVARQTPLPLLLQQVAMVEGMNVSLENGVYQFRPTAGVPLGTSLPGVVAAPGALGAPTMRISPMSGSPATIGGGEGGLSRGGGFGGPRGAPVGSPPGFASAAPSNNAGFPDAPQADLNVAAAGVQTSQQSRNELQYVLNYAMRANGAAANSPRDVFPDTRSTSGALNYIAVVMEAMTKIPGSAIPGLQTMPMQRLRALLGDAEQNYQDAARREQLQTEILVLNARIPNADPTLRPFLQRVLGSRQNELNRLGP